MSYYKPSFNQSMGRGRGYSSRGSFRGNSGGRGWGGGGGGRGNFHGTPRSGGGGNNRFEPSFNSTFDNNSRSKYNSGGDRSYSRSRGHDDFRKPYRMDTNYSGRGGGGDHRSPDRKRPRNDAPNSRHDSYGGSGYGSSRYDSNSSYSDRRSFTSDHHQSPFAGRRDDFRRPSGPPRGGYRGRISARGSRGLKNRDRMPRRRMIDTSYTIRKRVVQPRSTDFARKLKISKMRSAIAARKKRTSENEDDSDTEKPTKDDEEQNDDSQIDEDSVPKNDGNEDVDKSGASEKDVGATSHSRKDQGVNEEDKVLGGDKEEGTSKKTYIKLNCPHCGIKSVTFRKYDIHLQGRTHMMAMRKVSMKQKSILSQMRLAQRKAQNELEKSSEDLTPRTNFCPLCKLNYKQRKAVHQTSDSHKNMKKFLMPYCKVCSITFKSPMMYENHCCSIEHLKRRQRLDNGENSDEFDEDHNLENFTTIDSVGVDGAEVSEDEDVDKEETIKEPVSVGIEKIRKVEAYYCDLCRSFVGKDGGDETLQPMLVRHCKQRTHMQRYIRYNEDRELEKRAEKLQRKEIAEKEDKVKPVAKEAPPPEPVVDANPESQTEVEKSTENKEEEKVADTNTQNKATLDEEEARDDKLWADVDKDLDDILAKEDGNKSSDEDEDVNGERFDKFKYTEKNGDEKVSEKESGEVVPQPAEAQENAVVAEK